MAKVSMQPPDYAADNEIIGSEAMNGESALYRHQDTINAMSMCISPIIAAEI